MGAICQTLLYLQDVALEERKKERKKQVSDSLSFHSLRSPSSERHQLDSGQWMKTGLFSDDLPITICNVAFPSMES